MDSASVMFDGLPDGQPIEVPTRPQLTKAHASRLKWLWGYGRPVNVVELTGVDLDLSVHGLVEPVNDGHTPCARLTLTKLGVIHLNESRQALIEAQRPHHELGSRLAKHLRDKGFHTWENVAFSNPDWQNPSSSGSVRPDVFACLPALKASNASSAIYEVKVSRSDFLADLAKPEKRGAYAALAEAVYYCCPDRVIEKSDVPDGFGLLCEVEEGQFAIRKKARRTKCFLLAADTAMTLMVKRQVPIGEFE